MLEDGKTIFFVKQNISKIQQEKKTQYMYSWAFGCQSGSP